MSIQSNINQLIGGAAVFSQLPSGQAFANKLKWKRDWKKLEGTEAALGLTKIGESGHHEVQPITSEEQAKQAERIMGVRQDFLTKAREQGGANLYPRSIQNQVSNMSKIEAYQNALNSYRDITPEQAMEHMASEGQKQVRQKSQFNDYIGSLETNFGGTVRDLPEVIQKQIYEQLGREKK